MSCVALAAKAPHRPARPKKSGAERHGGTGLDACPFPLRRGRAPAVCSLSVLSGAPARQDDASTMPMRARAASGGPGGSVRRELPRADLGERNDHLRHPARLRQFRAQPRRPRRNHGARLQGRLGARRNRARPAIRCSDLATTVGRVGEQARRRQGRRAGCRRAANASRCARSCCSAASRRASRRRRACWCIRSGSATAATTRGGELFGRRSCAGPARHRPAHCNTPSRWAAAAS